MHGDNAPDLWRLPWPAGKSFHGIREYGAAVIYVAAPDGPPRKLPHQVLHSPAGLEWGYGGSGPADAAYSILVHLVGRRLAMVLHQDFKWEFIAPLPRADGWALSDAEILRWVQAKMDEKEMEAP